MYSSSESRLLKVTGLASLSLLCIRIVPRVKGFAVEGIRVIADVRCIWSLTTLSNGLLACVLGYGVPSVIAFFS